jgi:protein-tyrosine kinase
MPSLIEAAAKRLEQLRQAGALEGLHVATQTAGGPAAAQAAPTGPVALARPSAATAAKPAVDFATDDTIEIETSTLQAKGFITPTGPRTIVHDQYRVIKRQLIRNATGTKGQAALPLGNLIMVTSALAGEGKTFSSVNLAMSIASELDHTVLLVDADVARPSVLRTLAPNTYGASSAREPRGLLDLFEGQCELSDVILRTSVDKLSVMPSGSYRPHATELLASDGMRSMLEQVATRYPDLIVIFDSPPLLLTTEAQVLASLVGQVVVVVQAGTTSHNAVKSALATLENCPNKMMLLNRVSLLSEEGHDSYGYGYGAKQGYGYQPSTAAGDGTRG